MSCNVLVTSPGDCPPTCTASTLPPPETRFLCQPDSALIGTTGRGGQGGFGGEGSTGATPTNDVTLSPVERTALATSGQQDSGGFVITQTSVQVVTVGSSIGSGGSVTVTATPTFTASAGPIVTSSPTFSTRTFASTTSSSATTTTMSETTATAAALTATKRKKPFVQTTGGWVTIFVVVMVGFGGVLLWVLLRRHKKKMSKNKPTDGEADEAAQRRDVGDWNNGVNVPLRSMTIAGPEYRFSTAPVNTVTRGPFGSQRRPAKDADGFESQKLMAAGDVNRGDATTPARSEPYSHLPGRAPPQVPTASEGSAALRVGRPAPQRERRSMASSVYSGDANPEDLATHEATSQPEPAQQPAGGSRTKRRMAKECEQDRDQDREAEWSENAISGVPGDEFAADRAANAVRAQKLKAEADATQATQEVKDSWDPTKNICAGPPRQKMKPSLGIGPKALRKPEPKSRDSVSTAAFAKEEDRELEAEINELMDISHPTRIAGQEHDPSVPAGPPLRPMKSIRRGAGFDGPFVEVEVTDEEMERRKVWMAADREERRRQRDENGKVLGRLASPVPDNDAIQDERVEWGPGGPVKVGNPMKGKIDKNAIGRTALPLASAKFIEGYYGTKYVEGRPS